MTRRSLSNPPYGPSLSSVFKEYTQASPLCLQLAYVRIPLAVSSEEAGWTTLRVPVELGRGESRSNYTEWLDRWDEAALLFLRSITRIPTGLDQEERCRSAQLAISSLRCCRLSIVDRVEEQAAECHGSEWKPPIGDRRLYMPSTSRPQPDLHRQPSKQPRRLRRWTDCPSSIRRGVMIQLHAMLPVAGDRRCTRDIRTMRSSIH